MIVIIDTTDELYPELQVVRFAATNERGDEVSLPRALEEVLDFDKLALCVPTVLWPESWRSRYDNR